MHTAGRTQEVLRVARRVPRGGGGGGGEADGVSAHCDELGQTLQNRASKLARSTSAVKL